MIHYNKKLHINRLATSAYYKNLILLRNCIEVSCDNYFQKNKAPKVDLYLISREVSSPIGKGSDSIPIPIRFGNKKAYLADSAQFGMEPLVQKQFKMVYCYLPSFRGEDSDDRHLNQFYHCEAELRGNYLECMNIAELLVKNILSEVFSASKKGQFNFKKENFSIIPSIISSNFPRITFNEGYSMLDKRGKNFVQKYSYGRVITSSGEKELVKIVTNNKLPLWVTKYDRDVVPFYQIPDPVDKERVLNADLIFPSLNGGYGGEIVGAGQRQKETKDIYVSMNRQNIKNTAAYSWYIDIRRKPYYRSTSGFGLGIERLIAWMLGLKSIHDVCIYPVIKKDFN